MDGMSDRNLMLQTHGRGMSLVAVEAAMMDGGG